MHTILLCMHIIPGHPWSEWHADIRLFDQLTPFSSSGLNNFYVLFLWALARVATERLLVFDKCEGIVSRMVRDSSFCIDVPSMCRAFVDSSPSTKPHPKLSTMQFTSFISSAQSSSFSSRLSASVKTIRLEKSCDSFTTLRLSYVRKFPLVVLAFQRLRQKILPEKGVSDNFMLLYELKIQWSKCCSKYHLAYYKHR